MFFPPENGVVIGLGSYGEIMDRVILSKPPANNGVILSEPLANNGVILSEPLAVSRRIPIDTTDGSMMEILRFAQNDSVNEGDSSLRSE